MKGRKTERKFVSRLVLMCLVAVMTAGTVWAQTVERGHLVGTIFTQEDSHRRRGCSSEKHLFRGRFGC
jgi:hypothetical protein